MPINNHTTVTIPAISAVPEKTFDHIWLTDITIRTDGYDLGELSIGNVPYNGDTGELAKHLPGATISTDDLWTAVDEVSAVAVAMQAIFDAVEPLKAWISANESNE